MNVGCPLHARPTDGYRMHRISRSREKITSSIHPSRNIVCMKNVVIINRNEEQFNSLLIFFSCFLFFFFILFFVPFSFPPCISWNKSLLKRQRQHISLLHFIARRISSAQKNPSMKNVNYGTHNECVY